MENAEKKEEVKEMKELCLKMYELVQYAQYIDIDKTIDIIKEYDTITECVVFKHDKEDNDDIHYHIYFKLQTATKVSYISKIFGQPAQYFNRIKKRFERCLEYGTHRNSPSKVQYDITAVIFEKNISVQKYYDDLDRHDKVQQMILDLANNLISINEFKDNTTTKEYLDNFNLIEKARKMQSECLFSPNRSIKVYSITGSSGSGKTTLAKYIAESKGLTCYISSSGQNFMDDYNNEDVLIIDDFRGSQMSFSDLLKLIDNNTASAIRARYKNKLPNFKYVIITSINAPSDYYSSDVLACEPLKQLVRRISKSLLIWSDGMAYPFAYDENKCLYVITDTTPVYNVNEIIERYKHSTIQVEDLF